jgi:hypothetical protein
MRIKCMSPMMMSHWLMVGALDTVQSLSRYQAHLVSLIKGTNLFRAFPTCFKVRII